MNWIKARLNKDNFWNLMFWFGMCFSVVIVLLLDELLHNKAVNFISSWITILLVPYLIARCNKVKYTEDKIFLNSQGHNLMNRLPKQLFWVIFLMFVVTVSVGSILDTYEKAISKLVGFSMLFSVFLFVPTLYFICKSCPISILFNKNAWQEDVIGMRAGTCTANCSSSHHHANSYSSISRSNTIRSPDIINDPSYRYLSSNIYNSDR